MRENLRCVRGKKTVRSVHRWQLKVKCEMGNGREREREINIWTLCVINLFVFKSKV